MPTHSQVHRNRSPNRPKSASRSTQNRSREGLVPLGQPKARPKITKKPLKTASEVPRSAPMASGDAPRSLSRPLPKCLGVPQWRPETPQGRLGGPRRTPQRPKRLPKRIQNGVHNAHKSSTKFNMKQEGFEDPLGSVLGLSWVVLGSMLGSKIIKFHWFLEWFREKSLLCRRQGLKLHVDRSWVYFDAKKDPT